MNSHIDVYAADFQALIKYAAAAAGFGDPVAFNPDEFEDLLLEAAVRGPVFPVAGVMIRDWDRSWLQTWPGVNFGGRTYTAHGVRFARVWASGAIDRPYSGYNFFLVERSDYHALFRIAVKLKRDKSAEPIEPVMSPEQRAALWQNTVQFLDPANLRRIRQYGGRAKRGLLLTGPPGNGKTSACRWIKAEVERRGWEAKTVGPDDYQGARSSPSAATAVKELFQAGGRGVVFFDDMDIALRNRDTVKETDDQAVFLSALDGIEVNEGVVYVFTTNCQMELIDPAFRRPGRIDLTLHFPKPAADLRRKLMARWHADIRAALNEPRVVADTDGLSFAEIEELKNLLVLRYVDANVWDWDWAREQFQENRSGLASRKADRHVGFAPPAGTPTAVLPSLSTGGT